MTDLPRPTIFALSSGHGPAAIAVVRISGSRASDALTALGVKIPEPRKAGLARLRDPQSGEIIDEGLVLFFPGPRSETGEDVAELQLHGGRAVVAATLAALGRLEGLRMAEPGEFTRRAFENGKLDLTAVEGLADLVGAETEGQRRQAFRQMKGALGSRAESWRERLIKALALVEARIDFSDEADVPEDLVAPALTIVRELAAEIGAVLADGRRGERLREGLVVAIAGPPNAGKSTLLNRLAHREAAIVSPYAGTTRDIIEVHLDLDGWPVTLLDTAGIRETDDPIEMEGVRRARERAAAADLVLWLEDASAPARHAADPEQAFSGASGSTPPTHWLIRTKIDLVPAPPGGMLAMPTEASTAASRTQSERRPEHRASKKNESLHHNFEYQFIISAVSGAGCDDFLSALSRRACEFLTGTESALITRQRHRAALAEVHAALGRALNLAESEDLLAEELRTAGAALGRLTGRVDVEDVLDVIFRDFCIGK